MRYSETNAGPQHNARFTVGRDGSGHWVVADSLGLCGGIFADRTAAVHYALSESNYDPGQVCAAPDGQKLSIAAVFNPPGTR